MNFNSAHLAAITAFSLWGLLPLYWKIFSDVGAWDLFGQRLIWSFATLLLLLTYRKKWPLFKDILRNKKSRYMLVLSALFISSNWLIYIYAVNSGKVLEASMGYFLNPLINMFLGWLLLKEDIRLTQWPSILLALTAIVLIALQTDMTKFPWIAVVLAVTFALYGLIRKVTQVGSMEGLAFETSIVIWPVMAYWYFLPTTPMTVIRELEGWRIFLLSLSGLITCIPLVLFAYSAKRLRLQTLGFIQYLSPSLKFICGLVVFNEPLSQQKLQTFFLIWIALLWYTLESYVFHGRKKKAVPVSE